MSNRAKLLISILFIAAIILTIGLTRFYFDVTKNNVKIDTDEKVESIVKTYGKMQVFRTETGYCGVVNDSGAVIIEPEWMEVLDITDSMVIVSRRVNDTILVGGLDYEENIVLPFVYSEFQPIGDRYLAGVVAEDNTCLLYRRDYSLALPSVYESASYLDGDIELTNNGCRFLYHTDGSKLQLRSAEMQSSIGGKMLDWRVSNQVYLSDLSEQDLNRISQCIGDYVTMLIQSDFQRLGTVTASDYFTALSKPNSLLDAKIDALSGFSFSKQEQGGYDFAFTAAYHTGGSPDVSQTVQMDLMLRRNGENKMILTSANLDFRSTAETTTEPTTEPETDAE